MALRTSFARAKFMYSCVAFFDILRESLKCLAVLREMCMWLNGYFTLSAIVIRAAAAAVTVIVVHHHLPSSSAIVVVRLCPSSSAIAIHRLSHKRLLELSRKIANKKLS